jgi:uncharacterized membrane protein
MFRRQLAAHAATQDRVFRWRGAEVSRLEGFSDAVFAFAVTLLVVSLEVPHTFTELLEVMRGFAAFGLSFVMLIWVWYGHYQFFRRYGLHDLHTLLLNAGLLFVVLLYVFPLKFLSTLLVSLALNGLTLGGLPATSGGGASIGPQQLPTLMLIYGAGFAAINLLLGLLHRHALTLGAALELTPAETVQTRKTMLSFLWCVGVAALALLGPNWAFLSGMTYLLVPLVYVLARRWAARQLLAPAQAHL